MNEPMRASDELAAVVRETWSAAFYPTLLESLPFNTSIAQDYQGEVSNLGDTVNITNLPQFDDAEDLAEDGSAQADKITAQGIQLVINHQLVKDFIITKKGEIQSLPVMAALRNLALHSIMKKMQKIIIAEIVPSAAAPDQSIAYASGSSITLADIIAAKTLLDDADVEEAGRTSIMKVASWNALFNISGFVSRDFIPDGNSPLASGAIATPLLGFQPKWTSEASNDFFFHPIFLQMVVQQQPEVGVYDLGVNGQRGTRVNMDVLFGVKQCSNLRVVTVG